MRITNLKNLGFNRMYNGGTRQTLTYENSDSP
jgi:hypothetical protein